MKFSQLIKISLLFLAIKLSVTLASAGHTVTLGLDLNDQPFLLDSSLDLRVSLKENRDFLNATSIENVGKDGVAGADLLFDFLKALTQKLNVARRAVCAMTLVPQDLITRFGVGAGEIRPEWSEEVLCSKIATQKLSVFNQSESSAKAHFQLPVIVEEGIDGTVRYFIRDPSSGMKIEIDEPRAISRQEGFYKNVIRVFCALPVRPSILRIRLGFVETKWKISEVCKKLVTEANL